MSKLDWLLAVFIGGGGVLALIALEYQVPWLMTLGLVFAGAGLLMGSFSAVVYDKVGFWSLRWRQADTIQGAYSGFWGVILFLSGAILLIFAGERIVGRGTLLLDLISRRPGVVLLPGGLVPIVVGIPQMLGQYGRAKTWRDSLNQLGGRLRGLLWVLLGLGMIAVGAFELLQPEAFDQFLRTTLGPFAPPELVR